MYTHTAAANANALSIDVVQRLAHSWRNRVAVNHEKLDLAKYYDQSIPDYPLDLVSFRADTRFSSLDPSTRHRILAGAWILYNEKTIAVENSIVTPACSLLLRGAFPTLDRVEIKRVVAQTLVDEEFHILMCLEACMVARQAYGLEALVLPCPAVVEALERQVAEVSSIRHQEIIRLAFATVAELTINAYLSLLSSDQTIQPLNRETTDLHRKDEASHNKFFRTITEVVYTSFEGNERDIFIRALSDGLHAYVQPDPKAWVEVLRFVGVAEAQGIVADSSDIPLGRRMARDYSEFRNLLADLRIEGEIDFVFPSD